MTNIQKKSLQHISELLKSVESYPVYTAITRAMEEAGFGPEVRKKITDKYQEAMTEQTKKVSEARGWIDTMITDLT
jgi:hypothetical protein